MNREGGQEAGDNVDDAEREPRAAGGPPERGSDGARTQLGDDIDGEAADDRSGRSVALRNDGDNPPNLPDRGRLGPRDKDRMLHGREVVLCKRVPRFSWAHPKVGARNWRGGG